MTNNDILRRLRYLFDYSDSQMLELFRLTDYEVSLNEMSAWLKKEDDPMFLELQDKDLAIFLNGLIIEKRGKKDGPIVFVSAAIHGDELNGIEIIRRIRKLSILNKLKAL